MRQFTGILVLAAGWGWFGANFTPGGSDWWNYLLHAIPFLILLVLSLRFLYVTDTHNEARTNGGKAAIGLSIFAAFSFALFVMGIISGIINPAPDSYGILTVADYVPAIMIMLGALVWFTTLIPTHRGNAEARTVSNK